MHLLSLTPLILFSLLASANPVPDTTITHVSVDLLGAHTTTLSGAAASSYLYSLSHPCIGICIGPTTTTTSSSTTTTTTSTSSSSTTSTGTGTTTGTTTTSTTTSASANVGAVAFGGSMINPVGANAVAVLVGGVALVCGAGAVLL